MDWKRLEKTGDWIVGLIVVHWQIIVTGGSLEDSRNALELVRDNPILYSTVGCHPTRCLELEDNYPQYLDDMLELCVNNSAKVVAVGEFGLDYDRLHFCPKDVQLK